MASAARARFAWTATRSIGLTSTAMARAAAVGAIAAAAGSGGGGGVAEGGRPGGMRERQLNVSATVNWTDTGVQLRAGQTIYVEASGQVRWGRDRRDGPAGENNSPFNQARPLPNRPGAALIGRIGGDIFYVGDGQGPIRVRNSGRLELGINDEYPRGQFRKLPRDGVLLIPSLGMRFELSDEQALLRRSIREFAESEMRPHTMEWDEAQQLPTELLPKLAELGLMGIQFPEEYGGAGMSARRLLHLHRGARAGRPERLAVGRRAQRARRRAHRAVRHRGAEAAVPRPARDRTRSSRRGGSPSRVRAAMPRRCAPPPCGTATTGC